MARCLQEAVKVNSRGRYRVVVVLVVAGAGGGALSSSGVTVRSLKQKTEQCLTINLSSNVQEPRRRSPNFTLLNVVTFQLKSGETGVEKKHGKWNERQDHEGFMKTEDVFYRLCRHDLLKRFSF